MTAPSNGTGRRGTPWLGALGRAGVLALVAATAAAEDAPGRAEVIEVTESGERRSPWLAAFAEALLDPTWGARATTFRVTSTPDRDTRSDADPEITVRIDGARVSATRRGDPRPVAGIAPGGDTAGRLERDVDLPVVEPAGAIAEAIAGLVERRLRVSDAVVAVADAYRISGDVSAAAATALGLSRRAERDPRPHRILALCEEARGRDRHAARAWRAAVERAPDDAFLLLGLGRALARTGSPIEADTALQRAAHACRDDDLRVRIEAALAGIAPARRAASTRIEDWERVRDLVRRHEKVLRVSGVIEPALRARRIDVLEQRVRADPRDESAWLGLARALVDARLLTSAMTALREAVAANADSAQLRLLLSRLLLATGNAVEAARVIESSAAVAGTADGMVALGDCRMALALGAYSPRWSGLSPELLPASPRAFVAPRRATEGTPAAAAWDAAGAIYEQAITRWPRDERVVARRADWLLLSGRTDEAALAVGSVATPRHPDLLRVVACVREVGRDHGGALRGMARSFLAIDVAAAQAVSVARDLAALGGDDVPLALELIDHALSDEPGHAELRAARGRLLGAVGRVEEGIAELRFAIAAGDAAHDALKRDWEVPPIGATSARLPERAQYLPDDERPMLPGSPESVTAFVELRNELAAMLLRRGGEQSALIALAELRQAEWFLEREETRLRSTRVAPPPADVAEWTRPASRRDEPVDFGNARHRVLWASLRTAIARCRLALGDLERARRLFAWSARALAVRDGAVRPESAWRRELSSGERRVAGDALAGLAAVLERLGRVTDARQVAEWADSLAAP